MGILARMLVVAFAVMLSPGCSQRHILRMSNPEQASTVTLFDQGEESRDDDDTVIVLDDAERIAKVAKFLEARAEKWKRFNGTPPVGRYQISFRKGEAVSDRFWLEGGSLGLKTPSGEYYTCNVSNAERAELLGIFRFTTNFKSHN